MQVAGLRQSAEPEEIAGSGINEGNHQIPLLAWHHRGYDEKGVDQSHGGQDPERCSSPSGDVVHPIDEEQGVGFRRPRQLWKQAKGVAELG